jgi:hypothetical protein
MGYINNSRSANYRFFNMCYEFGVYYKKIEEKIVSA